MSKQGKTAKVAKTALPGKKSERDESTCIYGAGVILKHLEALEQESSGLLAGEKDIEFIHRARVATRRLRAAIPLFEHCFPRKKIKRWRQQIRSVTQALGSARDTDVQMEQIEKISENLPENTFQVGLERLLVRLRQERERLQPAVNEAAAGLITNNLFQEMREFLEPLANQIGNVYIYTPSLYLHSFQSIYQRFDAFMAYESILFQPEKVTELHAMRIAAKWLRYTMETFAPLYSEQLKPELLVTRKVQEMLGDIHDCDVWQVFIPEFLEQERLRTREYFGDEEPFQHIAPGIEFFRQNRQQAREATYTELLASWQQWQDERVWDGLMKTVQSPFFQTKRFYPPIQQSAESEK